MSDKTFKVGNSEYKVTPMEPSRAIDFCTDVTVALSPVLSAIEVGGAGGIGELVLKVIPNLGLVNSDKLKTIFKEVREQVTLPNGYLASSEFHFHEWFKTHPQDLLVVHVRGLFVIVSDFFPQELGTIIEGLNSKKV